MTVRFWLAALFCATASAAQVPYGQFLVASRRAGTVAGDSLHFLDPSTGDLTPLANVVARIADPNTATIDPVTGDLFLLPGLSSSVLPAVYRVPLAGANAGVPFQLPIIGAPGPAKDMLVQNSNLLLALGATTASGLWTVSVNGGTATQLGAAPDAAAVASDGQFAFVLTNRAGQPSSIYRYSFATRMFTLVASNLPESAAIEIFPSAPTVVIGTVAGELWLVDTSTGGSAQLRNMGQGAIAAVRFFQPGGWLVTATRSGHLLDFSGTAITPPLSGRTLTDLDVGNADVASFFNFARGCNGTPGAPPSMGASGLPSLGNTGFSFRVSGGRVAAPALNALGSSRRSWSGIPLPLDLTGAGAPGCLLLVNPVLLQVVGLDGSGAGSLAFPIPGDPALKGIAIMAQWWVLDAGANALGLAFSDGGEAIVR